MTLARAWRRQLYGASSAALIVPTAMLAALLVLALGGGFSQVGVLGQIFAGPPATGASDGTVALGRAGATARPLPAIPAAAIAPPHRSVRWPGAGTGAGGGRTGGPAVPLRGPSQSGGAITPVSGVAPIVSGGGSTQSPSRPAPTGSAPSAPSPQPKPSPKPTVVDRIVNTVTPVAGQLPGPAGPVATQAVESAGSAADGLLPPQAPPGLRLP